MAQGTLCILINNLKMLLVVSCVHATLQPTVFVGLLADWLVPISSLGVTAPDQMLVWAIFIAAPAYQHTTSVVVCPEPDQQVG